MTRWQYVKMWLRVSKAGMMLNILLGRPVAFRIKVIKGVLTVEGDSHAVLRDLYIEV